MVLRIFRSWSITSLLRNSLHRFWSAINSHFSCSFIQFFIFFCFKPINILAYFIYFNPSVSLSFSQILEEDLRDLWITSVEPLRISLVVTSLSSSLIFSESSGGDLSKILTASYPGIFRFKYFSISAFKLMIPVRTALHSFDL